MNQSLRLRASLAMLTISTVFTVNATAADQLHNTKWTSYNNGKAESILQFVDNNGKISAKIVKILDKRSSGKAVCDICKGTFKNKKLTGATIIWNLKADPKNPNKYIDGNGIKPVSGMTFKGKATLHGDTLKLRGYKGISLIGQTKTLKRVKK